MNCEKVNFILDSKSTAELTAAERQAIDQHLASCDECREVWGAYDELAALRIPATPPQLRVRIATALLARAERHRARRGFIVGIVLLAGAAAAATAVYRLTHRAPDSGPNPAQTIEQIVPAVEPVVPEAAELPAIADDEADPTSPDLGAAADAVSYPLDPYSIVVVSLNDPVPDAEATAALAGCYDAIVEGLRGVAGLNVIAGGRLKPFAGSTLPEIQTARELGAGRVLILRTMDRQPQCRGERFNVETGAGEGAFFAVGDRPRENWRAFGEGVARSLRESILRDTATREAEARATVLNTALDDSERAGALLLLRGGQGTSAYDEATLAAAVQIGANSRDANARATAWLGLRGVTAPSIVQPLVHSLANDAAGDVRSAAALTLAPFVDRAEVREGLTRAAAEVPSETPKVSCCEFTVRLAARLALRAGVEPNEAVRRTVLDESLTPQERLVLLPPASYMPRRLDQLGDEAAQTVFALGSSSEDQEVRSRAWSLLGDVTETDYLPALLDDLARHPAERVRAGAAAGLRGHRDDPDVRAALDRALADPSLVVQRAARNALDGVRVAL